LKREYFEQAEKNLALAESQNNSIMQGSLFATIEDEVWSDAT
jgi:hypothetical protein